MGSEVLFFSIPTEFWHSVTTFEQLNLMRLHYFLLPAAVVALVLSACGTRDLSVVDKIALNSSAMKFDHSGTALSECGLVSQLEPGRSSLSSAGGTG